MPLSFQYEPNFKKKKMSSVEEYSFTGGLVSDPNETKLETGQSPDEWNVVFNETDSIKTRNGYARYNNDPVGATSDESNTGASTGTTVLDSQSDYAAQTFQVGTEADMVQVDFYLEMQTSGEEQLVRAELWSGSTGPDALIAQSQILLVTGTSETEYSFRFRVPQTLSASTEYAAVIKPFVQGNSTDVNAVEVHSTGSAYANGAAYTSTDAGVTWGAVASTDFKFNVYTGGSTGATGMIRYYGPSGVQQLLAKYGTSLYRGNDVSGAMTAITLGSGDTLNSTNFIDHTVTNGTLLVVDDEGYIQKYRGSTNSNYTTGTISVTNDSTTVTGSGTSWATTTNAEIGEYIKLPDGKWYKITAIASNTSMTIETSYQGSTQSGQSYTISPWGEVQGDLNRATVPASLIRPQPISIENHSNRIWTLEDNTIRFSSLDTSIDGEHFNDWDTSNNAGAIIIPDSSGDEGKALYSFKNALYVFKRHSIWAVYGTSPANFELRNITREVGLISKQTLVEWNGTLLFLSDEGVMAFDGTNYKNLSEGFVQNEIDTWANKTSPTATLWNNNYLISYASAGSSANDEILFYDLFDRRWGKFKGLYASTWANWNGGTDSDEVYFGSSNQGSLYQFDTGGHDDGYEIETVYETPAISAGSPMQHKNIKRLFIQQIAQGNYNMDVIYYLDGSTSGTTLSIDLSGGSSVLWDVAEWGVAQWPDESTILTNRIDPQGNARHIKLRFYQKGYSQGIEVLGMLLETNLRRLI